MNGKQIQGITLAALMVLSVFAFVNPAAAATTTDVNVTPSSETVSVGGTQTFDVVVSDVDGGVGAYDIDLSLNNANAEITNVSLNVAGGSQTTTKTVASNGQSAHVETALADTTDSTTDLSLMTVTVEGVSSGSDSLDVTVNKLGDENAALYTVNSVSPASITVQSGPVFDVSYQVDKTAVDTGENVEVTATVENTGAAQGTQTVEFKTGSGVFATESVTVDAGDTETVSATTSFSNAGTYEVSVNSLSPTSIKVGSDAADADATIQSGVGYWSGQQLYTDMFDPADPVVLERNTASTNNPNWQFETDVPVNNLGEVLLDTSGYQTDEYRLSDQSGDTLQFDLRQQDFSTSADPTEVTDQGAAAVSEIEINSNRQGYSLMIADGDLTPNQIKDVFDVDGVAIDWNDDGSNAADSEANALYVTSRTFGTASTLEADFSGMDTGTYDTAFYVADTFVGDTTSITVSQATAAQVNFVGNAFYAQELGDYVAIPVSMSNTDQANLIVGSEDAGYRLDLALEDGNSDGQVTVLFNTQGAGLSSWTAIAAADDDSVSIEDETSLSGLIDQGDYQLRLSRMGDFQDTADTPDRLGTVDILSRETVGMNVWTAPGGIYAGIEDAEDVTNAVDDGLLTQDDTIANGQVVALEIEASGLQGLLSTNTLQDLIDDGKLALDVYQTNPRQNRDAKLLNLEDSLNNGAATVVNSPSADTLYVIVNTQNAEFTRDLQDGDEFAAEFEVTEGTLDVVADDGVGQVISTSFAVDEPTAEIDTNAGDLLILPNEETEITGETTYAAGTEFTVRVTGDDPDNRFVERNTTVVADDGTFARSFNLSHAVDGTPLVVQIRDPAGEVVDTVEGEIGSVGDLVLSDAAVDPESVEAGGAVTVTATVTNNGATQATETVELMVDGSAVDDETIMLDSGESRDVSITVPTRDLATGSHDVTLQVGDVDTTASFTIEEEETATPQPTPTTTVAPPPTATPTEGPTPTPEEVVVTETVTVEVTQEPTEEPTTTEGGDGPGFGIAVALIALLAAAFLAVRRQD